MRLLLSGGSHRATLGAIGAIGYFLWSENASDPDDGSRSENEPSKNSGPGDDRWSDVDEVVSVSGGSLLNAALATATSGDEGDTAVALATIRRRLGHDRLLPHRTPKRLGIVTAMVAVFVAAAAVVLSAAGVFGPDVLSTAPWPVLIGIAAVAVVVNIERRLLAAYQRDVIDVITAGRHSPIDGIATQRRYIVCASGLASGLPYYFTMGGHASFEPAYGAAISSGYTTADAAAASMALPGLGRVRAPADCRREILVDGGISGGFGEQVTTTIERRPEDTWRSDGDWFAVDAVRHLSSDSRLGRVIRSMSMVSLLSRWLKVSIEATYVNDLIDIGPGRYARVFSPNTLPPPPGAQVFRDGSSAAGPDIRLTLPERTRLGELQQEVASMGLFSLNRRTIDLGIVVGFVSTLEVRRGLDDATVRDGLHWLDGLLGAGGQLVAVWDADDPTTDVPAADRNRPASSSADA